MESLRFAKEMYRDFTTMHPTVVRKIRAHAQETATKLIKAEKFVMPEDCRFFEESFKALPEIRKLPYKSMLLYIPISEATKNQYEAINLGRNIEARALFVTQLENGKVQIDPTIRLLVDKEYRWLPDIRYYQINLDDITFKDGKYSIPGAVAEMHILAEGDHYSEDSEDGRNNLEAAFAEFESYALDVLALIEVLSCSNVEEKVCVAKKTRDKPAAFYDSYKVLTLKSASVHTSGEYIEGNGCPKREHLRRGHIRKQPYKSRGTIENIWINSVVINAGKGFGKVEKDYKVV